MTYLLPILGIKVKSPWHIVMEDCISGVVMEAPQFLCSVTSCRRDGRQPRSRVETDTRYCSGVYVQVCRLGNGEIPDGISSPL